MNRFKRLLALAAVQAAAASQGMTDLPVIGRQEPKRYKGNEPKCKTCVHFMTKRVCCEPMRMSCEFYKRKKRK